MRLKPIKRIAAGAWALLLGGSVAAALAPGWAGAATAPGAIGVTIPYACRVAGLVSTTFNLTINASGPDSVAAGASFSLSGVQVTTEIPANIVTEIISLLHVVSFSGNVATLDFTASNASPSSINGAPNGISFTIPFVTGQSASFTVPSSPESVGSFTAGHSGDVVVAPGDIVITTVVGPLSYSIDCSPPSSLPEGATLSIPIQSSGTTTTTTPTTPTTTSVSTSTVPTSTIAPSGGSTGPTVPTGHTGEPWAGWPYWAIVGFAGLAGLLSLAGAGAGYARRRRRPV
jgi:hypothetical protein